MGFWSAKNTWKNNYAGIVLWSGGQEGSAGFVEEELRWRSAQEKQRTLQSRKRCKHRSHFGSRY